MLINVMLHECYYEFYTELIPGCRVNTRSPIRFIVSLLIRYGIILDLSVCTMSYSPRTVFSIVFVQNEGEYCAKPSRIHLSSINRTVLKSPLKFSLLLSCCFLFE